MNPVYIDRIPAGSGHPFVLIAGPCVIEDRAAAVQIASELKNITGRLGIPFIFKASYDKANRTSFASYRGPGLEKGLKILSSIRTELGVPVTSDVHLPSEADAAGKVLDLIQIPAFLCRQTDLITAAAAAGKPLNIKKGQFLAPWDMENAVEKARQAGNDSVLITERGASFGYNNLVADMRSIPIMQAAGCPVVFDATHSVQLPGGAKGSSSGQRQFAPVLAKAALAAGADAVFMEIHPDPDSALSDGPNSIALCDAEKILAELRAVDRAAREPGS